LNLEADERVSKRSKVLGESYVGIGRVKCPVSTEIIFRFSTYGIHRWVPEPLINYLRRLGDPERPTAIDGDFKHEIVDEKLFADELIKWILSEVAKARKLQAEAILPHVMIPYFAMPGTKKQLKDLEEIGAIRLKKPACV
jgi:hypothetical protein